MPIKTSSFGTFSGSPVSLFSLNNAHGIRAVATNYGATLTSLTVPSTEGPVELTLGFDTLEDYIGRSRYFGCTVGRFANRIAHGKFTLNGKHHTLACNEKGVNHLHGGVAGFDKRLWTAQPFERPEAVGVRFEYVSPDGEEGYPGTISARVDMLLGHDNSLTFDYEARTTRPCPVNLTNHTYWNLAGAGNGTILQHELKLEATQYLPVDEKLIPTGIFAEAAGTPMDFMRSHRIGARIALVPGGYDHCYVIDEADGTLQPAADLRDPASRRRLQILTTEPGIQFYSGNFLNDVTGAGGRVFIKHGALCLETQRFPDSPNQPAFPSCILQPEDVYRHTTVHRIEF
ncbi:MAG: aldose epimerase family protein [Kiritimatiellia bacterium]